MEVQLKAQKMFEELGYVKYEEHNDDADYIEYYKEDEECDSITFYCYCEAFCIGEYCLSDMRILKAINQQCKELGWLDE